MHLLHVYRRLCNQRSKELSFSTAKRYFAVYIFGNTPRIHFPSNFPFIFFSLSFSPPYYIIMLDRKGKEKNEEKTIRIGKKMRNE